jgi:hypothetical protein
MLADEWKRPVSALLALLNRLLRRAPDRAGAFADAAREVGPLLRRQPRAETVDVEDIVGSVGRARELGRDFRPRRGARRREDDQRLARIERAMKRGDPLPMVSLYRLGGHYYVVDGHHRLAAALRIGAVAMDAMVTEFVPLSRAFPAAA